MMIPRIHPFYLLMLLSLSLLFNCIPSFAESTYALEVLPPEHKIMTDEETGAELIFMTTAPGSDLNLYFHEWSFLADSSMVLFVSDREDGGAMGYLTATGELVRFSTAQGILNNVTAAVDRNSVYGWRDGHVVEVALKIKQSKNPAKNPSKVSATERIIAKLPDNAAGAVNPNCDGTLLGLGAVKTKDSPAKVFTINIESGEIKTACVVPDELEYGYHVQWSHEKPYLLSFAALRPRLNIVDIRDGSIRNPYLEVDDELVTHEHWWRDNQIAFCGGLNPPPTEDAHVKLLDVDTGQVKILGAGSWWPEATPEEISKRNFWHCAGSDDGRWVVADNWHGDLTIFEAQTTRPHLLTQGHRTYGKGGHPHVGWDRKGEQVVFTSHLLGNPNVCLARIPKAMQEANVTVKRPVAYKTMK